MTQVSRHEEMLYKLDTKMYIMNQMVQDIMRDLSQIQYEQDLLDYIQL